MDSTTMIMLMHEITQPQFTFSLLTMSVYTITTVVMTAAAAISIIIAKTK